MGKRTPAAAPLFFYLLCTTTLYSTEGEGLISLSVPFSRQSRYMTLRNVSTTRQQTTSSQTQHSCAFTVTHLTSTPRYICKGPTLKMPLKLFLWVIFVLLWAAAPSAPDKTAALLHHIFQWRCHPLTALSLPSRVSTLFSLNPFTKFEKCELNSNCVLAPFFPAEGSASTGCEPLLSFLGINTV